MARESQFEQDLIDELMELYPGAIILKNDSRFIQGIPDRLILNGPNWAAFDAKATHNSPRQRNQAYYIRTMNRMSYASFVYPENKERFLDELQQTLRLNRGTRLPFRV